MKFHLLVPALAVAVATAAAAEQAKGSESQADLLQAELCSAQYQAFRPTWSDVILVVASGGQRGRFKMDHQSPPNLYFFCQGSQGSASRAAPPVDATYLTHKERLGTLKIYDADHPVTQHPQEVQVLEVDPPGAVK